VSLKEDVHRLVDALPESELPAAHRYLRQLHSEQADDPVMRSLMTAPTDDELSDSEEDEGAAEAWQEYLRGEGRPSEEVWKTLDHE